MSDPQSGTFFAALRMDSANMSKGTISAIRTTLGIMGIVAVVFGVLITFWPAKTATALAWLLGLYFLIAGIAYLGLGIFSKGISGGSRALDLILGVLFVIGGIIVLSNPSESAIVIGIFLGVFIGILWIIEGVVTLIQSGDARSRGWAIFFGILSLIAGVVLLFSPVWGAAFLFWFGGIMLIVLGIIQIVRAFTFGRSTKSAPSDGPTITI